MKKKLSWKIAAFAVFLILLSISCGKYAMYEITGAAPRLRKAIGKTVVLPRGIYRMEGEDVIIGQSGQGVLENVSYRWNDKVGFFDLRVDYGGGSSGLSPFEAKKVKILDTESPDGPSSIPAPVSSE